MSRILINSKCVIAGIGLTLIHAGTAIAADDFSIEVSNDDIAVQASNASLQEVLEELERLTGIPVKFVADTTERVTLNVGLTTIENAIGKITPNHMIVHEKQNGKQVIKELIIISGSGTDSGDSGANSGSAFLPNGQPAPTIEQPPQSLPLANDQEPSVNVELPTNGDAAPPNNTDQTN